MEHVPIVRIQFPIVQHVIPRSEPHVVNVMQIISLNPQRSVQHVQVRQIVQHVHRHRMHVRNVNWEIIPMESVVNYVIR